MQTVSPNTVHQKWLNNELLRSQYNKIVKRKSVAVWVRFAGIWDKIQHLYYSRAEVHIMIVPWHLLVNDTDLCCSPKSPKSNLWKSFAVLETRVFQVADGEDLVILACTVFDWSTHVTDGRTDGQMDRPNCDG